MKNSFCVIHCLFLKMQPAVFSLSHCFLLEIGELSKFVGWMNFLNNLVKIHFRKKNAQINLHSEWRIIRREESRIFPSFDWRDGDDLSPAMCNFHFRYRVCLINPSCYHPRIPNSRVGFYMSPLFQAVKAKPGDFTSYAKWWVIRHS